MKAVFIQEAFIRENYLRRTFALHLRMSLWKDLKTILLCTGPAFFNLEDDTVVYGYHLYDRLYPASTTKILTAYIALKYGNMDDQVTVSANATDFNWDESVCGLQTGDTLTMYDLVCGLLLHSGNDAAVAIAETYLGQCRRIC